MGQFTELLEKNFQEEQDVNDFTDSCKCESRLIYASQRIFNFTTYDSGIDEKFGKKMIAVLSCILSRTTYEYLTKSQSQHINYITMVNMPFLKNKIEWGGSVRGAWLDNWKEYEIDEVSVKKQELTLYISDLIEWVKIK